VPATLLAATAGAIDVHSQTRTHLLHDATGFFI
jgi:hypothetical protein